MPAHSHREVAAFHAVAARDRLGGCWELSLRGLRRKEVLGIRWRDVDLDEGTLTIVDSKTPTGLRVLPIDPALAQALRDHRRRLSEERLKAGEAYNADSEHLAVDELGVRVDRKWFSQQFKRRLAKPAGLPSTASLHDLRHTASTIMRELAIDPWTVAAWLGHTNPSMSLLGYTDAPRREAMVDAGNRLAAALTITSDDRENSTG